MNNMGFFNPFGGSGSGEGGGSTANYSVQAVTDSSGQVSYKLTKNGTAVGDVISFNGSNMLVSYGGELIVLNSAIAGIEEALDKTYNFTTFTELEIDTHNKTISQLSTELAAKNLEEGTVVTGRVYSEALPYNNYGNAEVLINNSIFWWKTSSSTISPYSWNAIVVGNTVKMDWTPTYYQLPIASAQSLGGVKIGDNVQIAPDGTISVITTKGDTGTGIASITKTGSSGLNDIYTITYTDSTTSTFTVTNGATITSGSIGQTGHLILTMSDGKTIDAGALPTDNEVEVTTTSSQPADPNVELWVDLSTQQTLDIPEINDSSTSSIQDTWSCKKIYDDQQRQEVEIAELTAKEQQNENNILSAYGGIVGKNVAKENDFTATLTKIVYCNPITGTIHISAASISSTDTDSTICRFILYYKGGTDSSTNYSFSRGSNISLDINIGAKIIERIVIYASDNYSHSIGDTVTVSDLMICTQVDYAADPTYQPYIRTNAELTVAEDEDRAALIAQVDNGAKNSLEFDAIGGFETHGTTFESGGVKFTLNADKTVTFERISTSSYAASCWLMLNGTVPDVSSYCDGNHILSGCPSGGGSSSYEITIPYGTYIKRDYGTGVILDSVSGVYPYVQLTVRSGFTGTETFKPMICTAADWAISQKFVPYALPNPTLTPAVIKAVDDGAKNLLQLFQLGSSNANVGNACTSQGVEYEIQSDGTITAYRKSSASSGAYIFLYKNGEIQNVSEFFDGNHIWSGNPPQYPEGGVSVWYKIGSGSNTTMPNGGVLPNANGEAVRIGFQISTALSPTQSNPIIFKPMICTLADWKVSQKYVPYCPSLQDLVVQKATNIVNGTTALSGTGVSIALKGGNIYRLTANAKYKAANLSEIAIKYTISGTTYSVCSNSITPTSNTVYLTTTGLINPSSDVTVETYVKTETNGNVEILLLAEKIYAS